MSIKTVNDVITRTLQGAAPKVIAIKGTWGCGKTHAWQNLIADLRGECHHQQYGYASLFGITSINQLRTALFANTQAISSNAKLADEYVDPLAIRIRDMRRSSKQFSDKITAAIGQLAYGKIATIAIDAVLPFLLKDMVICLDDFERMGDAIKADELLGFISELKEQNNCQVVLIFNDEKLTADQKQAYQNYCEKVIDIELVYAPTVDEAIQIALPANLPCRDQLARHIGKLKIRNIRILYKLAGLVDLIYPAIAQFGEEVLNQMARTLVLFVWMEYGDINTEERPSLSFYSYWRNETWYIRTRLTDHRFTESEISWDKLFCDYGLQYLDEFDRSIYQVIRNGYIEESQITHCAMLLSQQGAYEAERQTFLQAWDQIHDSFDDNEHETIQGFIDAIQQRIHLISGSDLDWAVRFLRRFGKDDIANELLEGFIDAHKNDIKWFNLEAYTSERELTDPVLRTRFADVYNEIMIRNQPSMEEVIRQIIEEGIHSYKAHQFVQEANQEALYAYFKAVKGSQLREVVKYCLANSPAPSADTQPPAVLALQQIAQESELNAYRVECFKITKPS